MNTFFVKPAVFGSHNRFSRFLWYLEWRGKKTFLPVYNFCHLTLCMKTNIMRGRYLTAEMEIPEAKETSIYKENFKKMAFPSSVKVSHPMQLLWPMNDCIFMSYITYEVHGRNRWRFSGVRWIHVLCNWRSPWQQILKILESLRNPVSLTCFV